MDIHIRACFGHISAGQSGCGRPQHVGSLSKVMRRLLRSNQKKVLLSSRTDMTLFWHSPHTPTLTQHTFSHARRQPPPRTQLKRRTHTPEVRVLISAARKKFGHTESKPPPPAPPRAPPFPTKIAPCNWQWPHYQLRRSIRL